MRILVIAWEYPPYVVGGLGKHVAELVPILSGLQTNDGPVHVDVLTVQQHDRPITVGHQRPPAIEHIGKHLTVHRVDVASEVGISKAALEPAVVETVTHIASVPTTQQNEHDQFFQEIISGNQRLIAYAKKLGDQHEYDIIHAHDWLTGEAGFQLKHYWKIPLIATIHATERGRHQGYLPTPLSQHINDMEWRLTFEAWKVVICSHFMRDELMNYFSLPQDKLVVIPNGLNPSRLHYVNMQQRQILRRQYAPNNERLLFYVGRITYEKGIHTLIRSMPHILSQNPKARLLVAGKNGQTLRPLAHDHGVAHAVSFLDFVSDRERDAFYQLVDAAIFPSLYEPFGIVALEAMALDCNLIASNVGGLGEVVQHFKNGLTIKPNDPASIAWAVNQTLSDPHSAMQRRMRAKQEVKQRYSWGRIAEETVALYEEVVAARRLVEW